MRTKPYISASQAEQYLQKADYCKREGIKAREAGDVTEALKYEEWAEAFYTLSAKGRKTEKKARANAQ